METACKVCGMAHITGACTEQKTAKHETTEEPVTANDFFGSPKAARVKEMVGIMLHQQQDKLAGSMLDEMISLALSEPRLDKDATSQELLNRFKFDENTGNPLSHETLARGLRRAMQYFDELSELREKVLNQKNK